jgi:hypothetical protein
MMIMGAISEADAVIDWRLEQLCSVGYPADVAVELAENQAVDLRIAIYLLEACCPLETALQILR